MEITQPESAALVLEASDKEVWLAVTGYEGLYEVSNLGAVRSLDSVVQSEGRASYAAYEKFRQGRVLKARVIGDGYLQVTLSKAGRIKQFLVHRLVASAFIPNRHDLPQVNHLDGIKANNGAANLEWCNRSRNMLHAHEMGLATPPRGADNGQAKITAADVDKIKRLSRDGHVQSDIATRFGLAQSTVSQIVTGARWAHLKT